MIAREFRTDDEVYRVDADERPLSAVVVMWLRELTAQRGGKRDRRLPCEQAAPSITLRSIDGYLRRIGREVYA